MKPSTLRKELLAGLALAKAKGCPVNSIWVTPEIHDLMLRHEKVMPAIRYEQVSIAKGSPYPWLINTECGWTDDQGNERRVIIPDDVRDPPIDWSQPIEWNDGTPAWTVPGYGELGSNVGKSANPWYAVESETPPEDWSDELPYLTGTGCGVVVYADGQLHNPVSEAFIRNRKIPRANHGLDITQPLTIRGERNTEVTSILWHEDEGIYAGVVRTEKSTISSHITFRPNGHITSTVWAGYQVAERKPVEDADRDEMEANPLWSSFG